MNVFLKSAVIPEAPAVYLTSTLINTAHTTARSSSTREKERASRSQSGHKKTLIRSILFSIEDAAQV